MQFDVVTIGGGFSGLIPACRAAEAGLSAAVLEVRSEERYPCSSRFSTGVGNIMGVADHGGTGSDFPRHHGRQRRERASGGRPRARR
jgi:succinate dehydrogenase/fumarate reductase flavoprotein subunit